MAPCCGAPTKLENSVTIRRRQSPEVHDARLYLSGSCGSTAFRKGLTPRSAALSQNGLRSIYNGRVPERIQVKIAVLTYRVIHGDAPRYLGSFTSTAVVPGRRALRSAGTNRLVVPPVIDFPPSVAELFRLPPLKSGTLYRNTSSHVAVLYTLRHLEAFSLQQPCCL